MATELKTERSDFSETGRGQGKRFLRTVVIAVVLLLLIAGGSLGYLLFTQPEIFGGAGRQQSLLNVPGAEPTDEEARGQFSNDTIIPLEEIIINIREGSLQRLFKLTLSIELFDSADNAAISAKMPQIIDSFQMHLRRLRISEIESSQAIYRIKEELLGRTNIIVHPLRVKNILFAEMLIQ